MLHNEIRLLLKLDLKTDSDGADLIQKGRAFHSLGATAEKAWSPLHYISASTSGCTTISGWTTGETKQDDVQSVDPKGKEEPNH